MKQFAFSRRSRLRLKKDFQAVFSADRKTVTKDIVAWHLITEGPCKTGLMVSRKTGGAVRRNRIKRLLREALRLSQNQTKEGVRLVLYPKAGCRINNLSGAMAALDCVRRKAKLFKE
ncbi:MAG: ribonuclease P protein component [Elusimicrobiales bacterium]|jgi:ribonuclease P protein component|nr:ribonuclease P protein component [Elusimicrobiales bacterium]